MRCAQQAAVPHLQHLHLAIDPYDIRPPPACDVFSLVPHLRSLHLEQTLYVNTDPASIGSICDMLALLPNLTALHGTALHFDIQDLIDIAAHATLERVRLQQTYAWRDQEWLGYDEWCSGPGFDFDSSDNTHTQRQPRNTGEDETGGDNEVVDEQDEAAAAAVSDTITAGATYYDNCQLVSCAEDIRRLLSALNRVEPTQRSVEARLSLATFLYHAMQVRKFNDPAEGDDWSRPPEILLHLRHQIAVLHSTLRRQLSCSTSQAAQR